MNCLCSESSEVEITPGKICSNKVSGDRGVVRRVTVGRTVKEECLSTGHSLLMLVGPEVLDRRIHYVCSHFG